MSKDMLQTAAILVAIFMMAWAIRGEIDAVRGEIAKNTAAIAKLEGALLAHIGGHSHGTKVAVAETE